MDAVNSHGISYIRAEGDNDKEILLDKCSMDDVLSSKYKVDINHFKKLCDKVFANTTESEDKIKYIFAAINIYKKFSRHIVSSQDKNIFLSYFANMVKFISSYIGSKEVKLDKDVNNIEEYIKAIKTFDILAKDIEHITTILGKPMSFKSALDNISQKIDRIIREKGKLLQELENDIDSLNKRTLIIQDYIDSNVRARRANISSDGEDNVIKGIIQQAQLSQTFAALPNPTGASTSSDFKYDCISISMVDVAIIIESILEFFQESITIAAKVAKEKYEITKKLSDRSSKINAILSKTSSVLNETKVGDNVKIQWGTLFDLKDQKFVYPSGSKMVDLGYMIWGAEQGKDLLLDSELKNASPDPRNGIEYYTYLTGYAFHDRLFRKNQNPEEVCKEFERAEFSVVNNCLANYSQSIKDELDRVSKIANKMQDLSNRIRDLINTVLEYLSLVFRN